MAYSLKKKIFIFWSIIISIFLCILIFFSLVAFEVFGELPSVADLQNPSSKVSTEVYSEDGILIGKFYQKDRIYVDFKDISKNVFISLVATEDERFYEHSGIDFKSLFRAIGGILTFSPKGGASTISQQLALNLLTEIDKNYQRAGNPILRLIQKTKEWVIALKLEKNFTKDEILTLYLNTVPFSENLYGIKNASKTYFQKSPSELNLEEAAVLIGMLKANTLYNPKRNPKIALERRNVVIEQVYKNNYIAYSNMILTKSKPMVIKYLKLDEQSGIATHFREVVREDVKQILKTIKKPNGELYDMYKDGLKIYTTLDYKMQILAEQSVYQHIPLMQGYLNQQGNVKSGRIWDSKKDILANLIKQTDRYKNMLQAGFSELEIKKSFEKKYLLKIFTWNENREKDTFLSPLDSLKLINQYLQAGFIAMDIKTGHVKAWVGGINYKYFKYDHVNINTKRQVGSSIKPLLYALAIMDLGYNYNTLCSNMPQCFPEYDNWCSHNIDNDSSESVPLWRGLALSINNVSAYLIKNVTPRRFVEFLKNANIKSTLLPVPSLCLGVPDISLIEMVSAYSMFPGKGFVINPIYITRIEDKNGKIIKNFVTDKKYVISNSDAYLMTQLMKNVVDFGTAASLRYKYKVQGEVAGKTGTTNDNADAWFIGYTPQLVAATWVGCDQRFISISSGMGFGGTAAMPIFARFIKSVYETPKLITDTIKHFVAPANYDIKMKNNNINNNSIKKKSSNSIDYNDLYF